MRTGMDSEQHDRRPTVLFLFPGPSYDLHEFFGDRLAILSRHFRGYVITRRPEAQTVQVSDFQVHAVREASSTLVQASRYLKKIAQIVRQSRKAGGISLIVSYDPLLCGLMGLMVSRLLRVPFVAEVNGEFNERANYLQNRFRLLQKVHRLRNVRTARFVLCRADGVKLLYPEQLSRLGIQAGKQHVAVFPNLTATERFVNLGEQPEVLLAGFPFFVKGVDLLLDAFQRLSPSFPEWRLTILGHYPDKSVFGPEVLSHPRIQVLDAVPPKKVPQFIGRCAVFALPSRTEGMGRVLLEAMAAGKPRIATKVGGISRIVDHDVDGILIPPDDVQALTAALHRLMKSPETRRRLGANGAKRAQLEFTADAYLLNTKAFYEPLIRGVPIPVPLSSTSQVPAPQTGFAQKVLQDD